MHRGRAGHGRSRVGGPVAADVSSDSSDDGDAATAGRRQTKPTQTSLLDGMGRFAPSLEDAAAMRRLQMGRLNGTNNRAATLKQLKRQTIQHADDSDSDVEDPSLVRGMHETELRSAANTLRRVHVLNQLDNSALPAREDGDSGEDEELPREQLHNPMLDRAMPPLPSDVRRTATFHSHVPIVGSQWDDLRPPTLSADDRTRLRKPKYVRGGQSAATTAAALAAGSLPSMSAYEGGLLPNTARAAMNLPSAFGSSAGAWKQGMDGALGFALEHPNDVAVPHRGRRAAPSHLDAQATARLAMVDMAGAHPAAAAAAKRHETILHNPKVQTSDVQEAVGRVLMKLMSSAAADPMSSALHASEVELAAPADDTEAAARDGQLLGQALWQSGLTAFQSDPSAASADRPEFAVRHAAKDGDAFTADLQALRIGLAALQEAGGERLLANRADDERPGRRSSVAKKHAMTDAVALAVGRSLLKMQAAAVLLQPTHGGGAASPIALSPRRENEWERNMGELALQLKAMADAAGNSGTGVMKPSELSLHAPHPRNAEVTRRVGKRLSDLITTAMWGEGAQAPEIQPLRAERPGMRLRDPVLVPDSEPLGRGPAMEYHQESRRTWMDVESRMSGLVSTLGSAFDEDVGALALEFDREGDGLARSSAGARQRAGKNLDLDTLQRKQRAGAGQLPMALQDFGGKYAAPQDDSDDDDAYAAAPVGHRNRTRSVGDGLDRGSLARQQALSLLRQVAAQGGQAGESLREAKGDGVSMATGLRNTWRDIDELGRSERAIAASEDWVPSAPAARGGMTADSDVEASSDEYEDDDDDEANGGKADSLDF